MGTPACEGKGVKGRAAIRGERPIDTAHCRQQHNPASCQIPAPPPPGSGTRESWLHNPCRLVPRVREESRWLHHPNRLGGRDALKGGEVPPSRPPSLCPATVPLTPSASLNGICNRQ